MGDGSRGGFLQHSAGGYPLKERIGSKPIAKLRYRGAYSVGCIYRHEYRTSFGSCSTGLPHHNYKTEHICPRDCCLLGRIPMESTIGGLSLSTNGGLNPYYWVLSRVGFILVARREKPRLSLVPGSFAKS